MASRAPKILRPLRRRDFALWMVGASISLLGDGFFLVALAWQVYDLSNVPTALGVVGLVWTLPQVLFLLVGGVASDRFDRRRVMISADLLRAVAIAGIGLLSVTGVIRLWHVMALIGLVGVGDAFFNPASTAIVPDLVGPHDLPQANALGGVVRPLMIRLVGPALGGLLVGVAGAGPAFLVDAGTFLASAVAVFFITQQRRERGRLPDEAAPVTGRFRSELGAGMRFVRANPWCWATLLGALLSLLVFFGPLNVLVPFLVRNRLGKGAGTYGLIYAAGGVGGILVALLMGQTGLPRRFVTWMYVFWTLGVAALVVFGIMTAAWQGLLAAFALWALFEAGSIIWTTMLQRLVPRELLGRVASLDWLVSTGLVPVSFALTGPVAAAIGASATMVGAGVIGAVLMGMLLFVPGVRDPERRPWPDQATAETGAAAEPEAGSQITPSSESAFSSPSESPSSSP